LSNENQPRLLSFTLDGWDVLGGKVSVSLSDHVAILVGRNGAGKSAILEGFEAISSCALGRQDIKFSQVRQNNASNIPKILDIEILTPTNRRLSYYYELSLLPIDSEYSESRQFSWNDHCQYVDEDKMILWSTESGLTTFEDLMNPVVIGITSSFGQHHPAIHHVKPPIEMQWVYTILKGIRIIGSIPMDQLFERQPSLLRTYDGALTVRGDCLADGLSLKILSIEKHVGLNEIERICQRLGLASKISVQKFVLSGSHKGGVEEYISSVLLDDINIGLLSNGTLRILSIIIEIVSSRLVSTIIIEEPEMQIHPGMLTKLLNEIEAYTFGENLIISTHSPQVVSWTNPDKINLIYRNDGQTFVRKLGEDEIHRVVEYLNEEGDLGEWIYSGILDE
jgi:hypothetical protein